MSTRRPTPGKFRRLTVALGSEQLAITPVRVHEARIGVAEHDGGVLLYLDQEGRGNGLANKMRAYQLQAQGFDTYDADELLGFDHDQRHYDFAAAMLKLLLLSALSLVLATWIRESLHRRAAQRLYIDPARAAALGLR